MANGLNSNVRFYKLNVLPSFDVSKHIGIFVHLTAETTIEDKIYKAGLWFGGNTSWEYLTNDTTPESITAAINALDVTGYAQATITPNISVDGGKPNSTLTILGIQEVDGKISNDSSKDFKVAIDGKYDKTDNKIATQSTVTTAINGLNAGTIQAVTFNTPENGGNTTLTFNGVKETNGVITQGDGASTFIVGDAKLNIQIGSDEAFEVFSANAQADSTIKLDGNVFKKNVVDGKNVLSIYTTEGVSSTNPLVTQKDIASLGGAMHYKGPVSSKDEFNSILGDSDAEEAGNVYIATGDFTHNGNDISIGDMIVFNDATNYNVIQSNITLGTGSGQIAANSAALSANNLVVASATGIETIEFDKTNLTDTTEKNTRTLSYNNGDLDGTLYHSATITDTFKVIGKDFTKSINISSTNRSIEIAKKTVDGVDTGVMVDLIWNTVMDA